MLKRDLKMTFASFLLIVIAIILPFGIIISTIISKKIGIINENNIL